MSDEIEAIEHAAMLAIAESERLIGRKFTDTERLIATVFFVKGGNYGLSVVPVPSLSDMMKGLH